MCLDDTERRTTKWSQGVDPITITSEPPHLAKACCDKISKEQNQTCSRRAIYPVSRLVNGRIACLHC